ncbi:MAG: site-specific integrase [Desulfovibrionaceae bacterium]|nr:site-specific integrase [Desulfovibrionaceae bacterium]
MSQAIFQDVAREWWEKYMLRGAVCYAEECWRRLEREVMPELGKRPLAKITPLMILTILRRIEAKGFVVTAHKVKSHISQTFRYGIACGLVYTNPARDLTYALAPKISTPRAAVTEPRQVGVLMREINAFRPIQRRCALQFAALTFVRPGELCRAEWSEIEMDAGAWRIPAHKMKMQKPHIVPLAMQTQEVLRELRALTGSGRWLFPSRYDASKPMGRLVLNTGLRRLGYGPEVMTAHGFRAMAATLLSEQGWSSEVIEKQLAHADRNQVRAAYQRSELLAERRKMMQAWADYLEVQYARAMRRK